MALGTMRKHRKVIFWVVVIFVTPTFVMWGAASYFSRRAASKGGAGEIAGKVISKEDFGRFSWRWQRAFPSLRKMPAERQSTILWEQLLLLHEARRTGIVVSDDELRVKIARTMGSGQEFNQASYETRLRQMNLSPQEYEATMHEQLLIEKVLSLIGNSLKVLPAEVKEFFNKQNRKIKVNYVQLDVDQYSKTVDKPSADEVAAYFDENKEKYRDEDKVQFEYLLASFDEIGKGIDIPEKMARKYYEQAKEYLYKLPSDKENANDKEEAEAGDSLADAEAAVEEEPKYKPFEEVREDIEKQLKRSQASARAKFLINDILDDIAINEADPDFEKLASMESEFVSKRTEHLTRKEIDAGVPGLGLMPPLSSTLFGLQEGQLSSELRSQDGICIVRMLDLQEGQIPQLKVIRNKVSGELYQERVRELAEKSAEDIRTEMLEKSMDEVAKREKLKIETSDEFTGSFAPQLEVAYDFSKLREGEISESVPNREGNALLIFQIAEVQLPTDEEFEKGREMAVNQLLGQKRSQWYQLWMEQLKKDLEFKKAKKPLPPPDEEESDEETGA